MTKRLKNNNNKHYLLACNLINMINMKILPDFHHLLEINYYKNNISPAHSTQSVKSMKSYRYNVISQFSAQHVCKEWLLVTKNLVTLLALADPTRLAYWITAFIWLCISPNNVENVSILAPQVIMLALKNSLVSRVFMYH